jgi:primosomal protein N'/peptide deformylase
VAALDEGLGAHLLLAGPTGSGKTEVYLRACAAALERGLGAIVLVPEIALAPQTVGRFRARFGDVVAVLHSSLTDAERRDERDRLVAGEARIVVGARSALFAPVRRLGVIVVDEEHDTAYKQDADPRYDARTVAAKRAALEGAVAVYGSATPRPESWERLPHLPLPSRIGAPLPTVRLVDLRREAGYPLSAPLLAELGHVVDGGGRAILLLNRRGVAPAIHCRACGRSRRCPSCDVALTLHRDERLHCHHCGRSEPVVSACDACGSVDLAHIGAGTQRLERELALQLPELELIRLDADVTSRPGALRDALDRFRATERCALIGTQIVAKGHHVPGVRLAAVVDGDTGLGFPDFRAEERTFQLVTQLAGRSGRDAPGRVVVQTFQPDATPFLHAVRHDVAGFLAGELERRRALGYPPFRHLVTLLVSGPEPDGPLAALRELRGLLADAGADLLGPAPLIRLRGRRGRDGDGAHGMGAGALHCGRRAPRRRVDEPRRCDGRRLRVPRAAGGRCRDDDDRGEDQLPPPGAVGVGDRPRRARARGPDDDGRAGRPPRRGRSARLPDAADAGRPSCRSAPLDSPSMAHDHAHDHEAELDPGRDDAAAEEQELRRRLALAQIRQYGDPVLRMRAPEVTEFDDELGRVAERMIGLMHDAAGVGLAATQVGVLRRIFVFSDDGEDRVLVNPEITTSSGSCEVDEEGCLSLGTVRVDVERPVEVTVEGRDVAGQQVSLRLEGLSARVAQHEIDHLDGTLIIDRTDPESRREALRALRPRLLLSR